MTGPSGRYNRECELLEKAKAAKLTREKTDRPHCEALLDVSQEDLPISRVVNTEDVSLCSWGNVSATPNIISQAPRRRKPKDETSRGAQQQEEVNRLYQPGNKSRVDKFDLPFDIFRDCIENTSWHYAPNNAQYRRAKSQNRQSPDYSSIRRTTTYITAEQKQLQREIQQELRRQYEKEKEAVPNKTPSDRDSINDKISAEGYSDRTEKSSRSEKPARSPSSIQDPSKAAHIQGDTLTGASMKILTNKEPKVDIMKDETGINGKGRAMERNYQPRARSGGEPGAVRQWEKAMKQLPPIDVPFGNRGHRPGAYLSTRLSIMDEEMRRDLMMRQSQDDSLISFRSRSEPPQKPEDKNNFLHPVLESLFTVKSLNKAKKLGVNRTGRSFSQGKILPKTHQEPPSSATNSAPSSGILRMTHGPNDLEYMYGQSLGVNKHRTGQKDLSDKIGDTIPNETPWGVQDTPMNSKGQVQIAEPPGDVLQPVHNMMTAISGKGYSAIPAFQRIL